MYDQRWSADWIAARAPRAVQGSDLRRRADGARAAAARIAAPAARRRRARRTVHRPRPRPRLARRRARVEPADRRVRGAASGGVVHQGNLHTWSPTAPVYDAVTLTDVLEHIPDPRSALRRARDLLAPGGWIADQGAQRAGAARQGDPRARGCGPAIGRRSPTTSCTSIISAARRCGLALEREGFTRRPRRWSRAPEMPDGRGRPQRVDRWCARLAFRVARGLPGGTRTPLAFNLQAYGRRA